MKRILKIIGIVLIVLILGFGVWFYLSGSGLKKIVVEPKWVNQAQFAGIFVAKEKGFYRNSGVNVEVREFGFETNVIQDLIQKKVDIGYTTPEELLRAVDNGEELVAVAAFYQISPMTIVSLVSSGIETPADFKNKVLGNKAGNVEEDLLYGLMLKGVGLSEKDATIKKVGFETRELDDLKLRNADTIDLYRTDQLYYFNREKVKYNLIYPERFGVNSFTDLLVVRKDWLKENSETLKNFLRATVDGWKMAIADPKGAVSSTMKYITMESYKNFDYEVFILEQSIPLIRPTSESDIGMMDANKWEKVYNTLQKAGYLKNKLDLKSIYTNSYLP